MDAEKLAILAEKTLEKDNSIMVVHQIINDYDLSRGGAQRIVRLLHTGLNDDKFSSRLIGLSSSPTQELTQAESFGFSSVYNWKIPFSLYRYFRKNVSEGDVVHAHLFPTVFHVSVLKQLGLLPTCTFIYTQHSTSNRRRNKWWGRMIDSISYKAYDHIVGISHGTTSSLLSWKPELEEKLLTINNGADLNFSEPISRKSSDCKLKILSVGRLHRSKNYATAIRAIALIKDVDFEFQIAGIGPLQKDLMELAKELKISDKVKFLGYVPDLSDTLRSADIFLLTSTWEGFGLAAVEAMNASLPCVLSDVIGLRELIQTDGHEGYLIDPENPQEIAEKLKLLTADLENRNRMGLLAFNRSKSYGVGEMIKKYTELYKKELVGSQ
ncbi:glycosyltransferase family 4 protein [Aureitalea marina]|uniref:Uncharacterized protein n=1 Tax=Aureitalea marina TaxID=930804 RepID=A0A2S7KNP8_9FLAO|nr:glycosyltransferase family 4 protein [Aureitalea marina]PQB04241.1 hypothetical protein BST85_04475 [Aureitalea marina]